MWRLILYCGGSLLGTVGIIAAADGSGNGGSVSMDQALQVADKAGVILILVLVLVGGLKGWWVFGSEHRTVKAELMDARAEIKDFNAKQLELIRTISPLLSDATRALGEVKEGMEATIKRRPSDTDEVLRRLERVIRDIDDRRGRTDDGR